MIICGIYKLCQESLAASGSSNASVSDVQLIARAINGEARGESYEGQVAVRSRNPKQSKRPKLSKHNSRSNIPTRSLHSSIRRANKRTNRRKLKRSKSSTRRTKWMGPNRRMRILLQPKHSHKQMDMVKNNSQNNRQTPLLQITLRQRDGAFVLSF